MMTVLAFLRSQITVEEAEMQLYALCVVSDMQGVEGELLFHTGPLRWAPLKSQQHVSRAGMLWGIPGDRAFQAKDMASRNALRREPICSFKGKQRGYCGHRSVSEGDSRGRGARFKRSGNVNTHSGWCRRSEVMGVLPMFWQDLLKEWMWGVTEESQEWLQGLQPEYLEGELPFIEKGRLEEELAGGSTAEFSFGCT